MSSRERRSPPVTSDLIRKLSDEVQYRSKRKRKRQRRLFQRLGNAARWLLLVSFVINPLVIAVGFNTEPRHIGTAILVACALFGFTVIRLLRSMVHPHAEELPAPAAPQLPDGTANLGQLPAHADEWLYGQREYLPTAARSRVDSISKRLDTLATQLQGVSPEVPGAAELKRLLSDELPELVQGYRKVPRDMQQRPLHGGLTPEAQLVEGLTTIDVQIGRLQETLASDDMRALATHQRYLDLKYKRDDELK